MTACIVGWSHSKFGKLDGRDAEDLIVEVAVNAIRDAGIEPKDVDAIYLGHFNGGLIEQDFTASLVRQAEHALRTKAATRVGNAGSAGPAAIDQGLTRSAAKRARFVVCDGVEKMTPTPTDVVGNILVKASYEKTEVVNEGGFAGVFD